MTPSGARRILALVLPELLIELSEAPTILNGLDEVHSAPASVVILVEQLGDEVRDNACIDGMSASAKRLGLSIGQSIIDATALVSSLIVSYLERATVLSQLLKLAEVCQSYGSTISVDIDSSLPNTIWIDVTGVAHLFGGEEALASEVQQRVQLLGHRAPVTIANGPFIAQAIATYHSGAQVLEGVTLNEAVDQLPLTCLRSINVLLSKKRISYFAKLGIFSLGRLKTLPAPQLSARLGPNALAILELLQGHDRTPLNPCSFPEVLEETTEWEEPLAGREALFERVRLLLGRLSARLEGRGLAASTLVLVLHFEAATARFQGILSRFELEISLSKPIQREHEFEKIIWSRLEKLQLLAPTLGAELHLSHLEPQLMRQTNLSQGQTNQTLDSLPVLIAELEAEVGAHAIGVLENNSQFKPETRSKLLPLQLFLKKKTTSFNAPVFRPTDRATRIFTPAISLRIPLQLGESFLLNQRIYTIEQLRFAERIDDVQWWNDSYFNRDYLWGWLSSKTQGSKTQGLEALFYIDRSSSRSYLQGLGD